MNILLIIFIISAIIVLLPDVIVTLLGLFIITINIVKLIKAVLKNAKN